MPTLLLDQLYGIICEVLENQVALADDTELWRVGIDSIGIVHVMARCEDLFGIDLDPEDLTVSKLKTPGHIARLLQQKYVLH